MDNTNLFEFHIIVLYIFLRFDRFVNIVYFDFLKIIVYIYSVQYNFKILKISLSYDDYLMYNIHNIQTKIYILPKVLRVRHLNLFPRPWNPNNR